LHPKTREAHRSLLNRPTGDIVLRELPTQVIRYAILTNKTVLLRPTDSPYGNRAIPYFPFFPDFFNGHTDGMIEDLKDPQKLYNKSASQALHIMNQSANRPIMIEEDSVDDLSTAVQNMNRAGLPVIYRKDSRAPAWGDPPPFPQELFTFMNLAHEASRQVSGLPPALQGVAAGSREPARAAQQRAQQGATGLVMTIHNWLQSEILRGLWTVDAAQRLLTEPHMIRVVGSVALPDQVQEIALNQPTMDNGILKIMNDLAIGMYDIRIDHTAAKATLRQDHIDRLIELASAGAPIPTDIIIEMMDGIPPEAKARIIQGIQVAQMAALRTPGSQVQT